jgi:hypothetical protein
VCLLRVPAVFVGWPVRGGVDAGALFSGSTLEEQDVDACWGRRRSAGGLGGSDAYRSPGAYRYAPGGIGFEG